LPGHQRPVRQRELGQPVRHRPDRQDGSVGIEGRTLQQLQMIARLHELLSERSVDYWIFGGWAVDLHAGRLTREHSDVDIAVWLADLDCVADVLEEQGFVHVPDPDADGYTAYERGDLRVEVAVLARDSQGVVHTPLARGRGEWPAGSFGSEHGEVEGVRARVVGLAALLEDKSGPRDDPTAAAKDRADVTLLASLPDSRG
jgi:Aminoglycoside-2''-adenylyltransferase